MPKNALAALMVLLILMLSMNRAIRHTNTTGRHLAEVDKMTSSSVERVDDFKQRASVDAVIVHLDVDWSGTAMLSRPPVRKLLLAIRQSNELQRVDYLRVDVTKQDKPWMKQWLRDIGCSPFLVSHGAGSMIWLRSGKVARVIDCPAENNAKQLITWAQQDFSETKTN